MEKQGPGWKQAENWHEMHALYLNTVITSQKKFFACHPTICHKSHDQNLILVLNITTITSTTQKEK